LTHRAARTGALLVPVTTPEDRWRLTRAIATAARQQPETPEYRAEVSAWTGRGRTATDGVLSASSPGTGRRHDDTAMRVFPGGLLVVATLDDDPVSVLRASEATSVALLTATDLGLATCPLVAATRSRQHQGLHPATRCSTAPPTHTWSCAPAGHRRRRRRCHAARSAGPRTPTTTCPAPAAPTTRGEHLLRAATGRAEREGRRRIERQFRSRDKGART
jgi:hypothetical protein